VDALGVNLWPCVRSDHANDNYTVVQIANGQQDDFIREQAGKVKEFQFPLFIRFGAEFNIYQGSTFEGQTDESTYIFGDSPQNFIAAWRHYVEVFRQENVSNAIFMWNPNFADFGPNHYTAYYPGDEYVDWVGIDIYQYEPTSSPMSMLRGVYDEYSDQKPIAVAEWGTNWLNQHFKDEDRARFVNNFFDAVETMPEIKMVNYWYYQDFKFSADDQPLTAAAYQQRAASPRYIES
jgi:beta-mannanase